MANPPAGNAPRGKKKLWIIVCLVGVLGGALVPSFVGAPSLFGKSKPEAKPKGHGAAKTAAVPFGEAVVNLADERSMRYLRVKIILEVDAEAEKTATEHLNKTKAPLKSWLISHLAGKSLLDVRGTVGVKRLQREILERFDEVLYPEGDGPLRNILFEEFVVQ